jgi:polysaccharide export outer membrane protein
MVTTSSLRSIFRSRYGKAAWLGLLLLSCARSEAQSQQERGQAAAASAAAQTGTNGTIASGLVDTGDLPINVGDVIAIQVFATPELSGSLRVDQTGAVTLPIGGRLQVSGLTTTEAATKLEEHLKSAQIMIDPHVTVVVSQSAAQGITITGEVKAAGFFPLVGPHSVADALAIAGEPTTAAGDTITLIHRSDPAHPVVLYLNAPDFETVARNTPIYPRDTLTVSKASVIYLIGDIGRVGPLPVVRGEPPTILNVLAQSGGPLVTAALSRAIIIRKTTSGTTTIPLNLAEILKNRAPNILLQSADILIVPHSSLKAILQPIPQQLANTALGIGTAALYVR